MLKLHYTVAAAFLAIAALAASRGLELRGAGHEPTPFPAPGVLPGGTGAEWFQAVRPFCNTVEVEVALAQYPPPAGQSGWVYAAACYALAGKIERAREFLLRVDAAERWQAAGIVFEIAHPIADMGDDESAGPIMELVVEFWPNHYMALYHAGAAAYGLERWEAARTYLKAFRTAYQVDDGWRTAAAEMLRNLGRR
jgi:hypothetical protein